jgi:hypothetical protein
MNVELNNLAAKLETVSEDVRNTFGSLSAEQLNWKPSPEKWSIGQCLDHLIAGNTEMLAKIWLKVRAQQKPTFFEKLPLLPKIFAPLVVKAVSPESVRKVRNPRILDPAESDIPRDVVTKFLDTQAKAAAAIEAVGNMDPEKIVMTSPVAPFITYSLLDGYRIVVYHGQRHLNQAKRVMETDGFPGEV